MTGKENRVALSRILLAFLVIPNCLIAIAPKVLSVSPRGLINLDYLLVGIAVCGQKRAVQACALAATCAIDIVDRSLVVYHFTQKDLSGCARSLFQIPAETVLECGAGALLASTVVGWGMAVAAPRELEYSPAKTRLVLAFAIVLAAATDIASGTNGVARISETRFAVNVASSPVFSISRGTWSAIEKRPEPLRKASRFATLPVTLHVDWQAQAHHPNIVVILVESYGKLNDDIAAQDLARPFDRAEVRSKYDVQEGSVPFDGGTVAGEIRELCGLIGDINAFPLSETDRDGCLPKRLARQGYSSTALHGYSGEMFDRRTWYKQLGFTNAFFLEELGRQLGNRRCGGFLPGACDADIANLIRVRLGRDRAAPSFVYWVTLNSHLPTPRQTDLGKGLTCGEGALKDRDLCVWGRLIYNLNDSIANIAVDRNLPPTEFILVGDHAPPFWMSWRRDLFSRSTVPYIRLIPRDK